MAEDLIVADPQTLDGKPCVRGTRLSVEFLLELAAAGPRQTRFSPSILSSRPRCSRPRFAMPRTP